MATAIAPMDLSEEFVPTCFIGDGYIGIKKETGAVYDVDFDRCRTQADILHWVTHLTLKTWVTREMLRDFIKAACDLNDIHYY